MDEEKALKINAIREYLLTLNNTPYYSEKFSINDISVAYNSRFVNDEIKAFINPPINPKTRKSVPEIAMDFAVLKNGDVWCRTLFGNEYKLDELIGESLDTILKAIEYHKSKKAGE